MRYLRNLLISIGILLSHRLRTTISVAGVAVGVATMTVIVSVGDGMRLEIEDGFRSMGADLVVVRAGQFREFRGRARQTAAVTTLTRDDAEALLASAPGSLRGGPAISRSLSLRYEAFATQSTVEAVSPGALDVRHVEIAAGRLFQRREYGARATVAVIGQTVATNLFRSRSPVGQLITVGRLPFRVVGVAGKRGMDMNGNDQDNVVYVPLDTGMYRLFHVTYVESIYLKADDGRTPDRLADDAAALLRKRHRIKEGKEDDFAVQNQTSMLAAALETSNSTALLVEAVGAITLLVAGVGILAVMLMSVRERRPEIGLRRAIGARRSDILVQFLAEAAILAIFGGALGMVLGALAVVVCNKMALAPAIFSVAAAGLSLSVSVFVGVVFGLHPALKASRMQPAEALAAAD